MNTRGRGSAWRLLSAVVLLSLALVLLPGSTLAQPTPAPASEPPALPAAAPASTQATTQAKPVIGPPSPAAPQEDLKTPLEPPAPCSDSTRPASAQHILAFPEQEVAATYKAGSDRQEYIYYDYAAATLTNRVLGPQNHQAGAFDWGRGAAADINGDGYDEIMQVGRGDGDRLTIQSFVYGPDYAQSRAGMMWWASENRHIGGQVKWMDITAGNVLRHSDGQRDVVVVMRNDEGDLELLLVWGTGGYNFSAPVSFRDAVDGRENVWHTTVATGDLTGSGYDDTVVAAFKDGGNHLQVLALRYDNGWQKLGVTRFVDEAKSHGAHDVAHSGDYSTSPTRGIDIATGDVDSDGLDEAVVSFVDDNNRYQVMALGLSKATSGSLPYTVNDEGFYRTEEDTKDPQYVGVAAPDLNGDGTAEIVAALGGRFDCCSGDAPAQVWRLHYGDFVDNPGDSNDQGTMLTRDLVWKDQVSYDADDYNNATYVTIEKVNVDAGGRDKAVLAFNAGRGGNDWVSLRVLAEEGDEKSLKLVSESDYDADAATNYDVTAIAGDINKDSQWLTYQQVCKQYGYSAVNAVVNTPPLWYDKSASYEGLGAAIGMGMSGDESYGESTKYTYGASYTIDGSVSFADIVSFGPKISAAFEGSQAVKETEKFEAGTNQRYFAHFNTQTASGLVVQHTVNYRSYKYKEDLTGKEVWVRVPAGSLTYPDVMERWNSRMMNRGWLRVGPGPRVNAALGKPTTQSSDYYGAYARLAVDGNTDGDYFHNSVSHTLSQAGAWWRVDLGDGQAVEEPIESVTIWNRTDCCQDRLKNFIVQVYDKNFALRWTSPTQSEVGGRPTIIPVGKTGRYVRVQLVGTNYLSLAEVEVWKVTDTNLALGKPAKHSPKPDGSDGTAEGGVAGRAVDGNTDGAFANGSVSLTTTQTNPWWQVDLGAVYPIREVHVWNRSDECCTGYLKNYRVKVAKEDTEAGWTAAWTSILQEDAAQRPTAVWVGVKGRYVRIQLEGTNPLNLAEVQVWKGREVPDFPKTYLRDNDNYFTLSYPNGATQRVTGNLKWDWCQGYLDDTPATSGGSTLIKDLVSKQDPEWIYAGSGDSTWQMYQATGGETEWSDSWGIKGSYGMEAKMLGMGAEWSVSGGFEKEYTTSVGWNKQTYFEGRAGSVPGAGAAYRYQYCPFYYVTSGVAPDGAEQAYMVVDYYVKCYGETCPPASPPADATAASLPVQLPQVKPGTPVISSSTHPDPDTWYPASKVTFTWQQPAGDPVTNPVYDWVLDQQPDTTPELPPRGKATSYTYANLADGEWYLHVRAMGGDDQWSDTAHRRVRIDRLAPVASLVLDPPTPAGNQGWYTVPVTVSASATDAGSGVAALEISTDGAAWQPYTAPLQFNSDTPGATVWARATDHAGHASEVVSVTVRVDLTAPDSHTGTACQDGGVCSGRIYEATSRIAGMEIKFDDGSWTSVTSLGEWEPGPGQLSTPWAYAALLEVGHGKHRVYGRAVDGAGRVEAEHQLAEVTWFATAAPDLSASSIAIEPSTVRPGEPVTVTLNVRNGGFGEAYVTFHAKLPAGLTPVGETGATYDAAIGVLTWPVELLWPGERRQARFQAVVASDLPPGNLTVQLDAHGSWPNIAELSAEEQQQFRDLEDDVTTSATLQVDPALPLGKDVTPPHARLAIQQDEVLSAPDRIHLVIGAEADVRQMYVREWNLDPTTGTWTVARSSGWLPYEPSLSWDLSEGAGVKYVGVWVADGAWNVSQLDEASLAHTNRLLDDSLLAGQRRQYRFMFEEGLEVFNLLGTNGQSELYGWLPAEGGAPEFIAEGGLLKALAIPIVLPGVYVLEAAAVEDMTYRLLRADTGDSVSAANLAADLAPTPPEHPLTLTTPLTAGAGAAPVLVLKPIYLPLIFR